MMMMIQALVRMERHIPYETRMLRVDAVIVELGLSQVRGLAHRHPREGPRHLWRRAKEANSRLCRARMEYNVSISL